VTLVFSSDFVPRHRSVADVFDMTVDRASRGIRCNRLHEREGFWGRLFTVKFEVLRHLPSSLLSISDFQALV
jgi:hypothetical protein